MKSSRMEGLVPLTPAPKEIYNYRIWLLAVIASMGAILFGYDLAFIGTTITLEPFKTDFHLLDLTTSQVNSFSANIVSSLQAGCFFGSLFAAPLSDKFGRRIILALAGIIFCIGSAMQTASNGSRDVMYIGRVIGGLGVGAASMLVPLYIAEVSPPAIRGRLVGVYEISVQFGTLTGFWINYGVSRTMAPTSAQWMTPFAIQLIPGGLLTLGMLAVPESPRWLARVRGREAAINTLATLRNLPLDAPYVQEEAAAIIRQIEEERMLISGKGIVAELRELFGPNNRYRIFLGVMLFIFMQMAGSNAINYFSPRIFASIGLKGGSTTLVSTGIYGVVRFVAVIIAMVFFVDQFGRTKLLIWGSALMAFCMYFTGAYVAIAKPSAAHPHLEASGYATATMIYVYAVGYCFSWAGIPWIYASEIFPIRIRGLAMAICTAVHWLMNFMIARSVPYMISNIGYGTYLVFAACLTLAVPFVYFLVPETKGRSLENIDAVFHKSQTRAMENMDLEKDTVEQVETVLDDEKHGSV